MIPYWYELPPERIADRPVHPYHAAKMLVVNRERASLSDSTFLSLTEFLSPGDVMVFNDSKVLKSRLFGKFEDTGGEVEVLTLDQFRNGENIVAISLGRPLRRFREGRGIRFSADLRAVIEQRIGTDKVRLRFESVSKDVSAAFEECALMPIPPYIRGGVADKADDHDYQTCFAKVPGAIAAPTASLHFTPDLLTQIKQRGIQIEFLTLHVGRSSFSTLWEPGEERLLKPESERLEVSPELVSRLTAAKADGRRIIAVGTTVVRALESAATGLSSGETELFIIPGFEFKIVNGLVTNFHQPGTTHLLLVEAFLGRELLEKSYNCALDQEYRLLSYGDGMLIL